jgi:hypothetical protein
VIGETHFLSEGTTTPTRRLDRRWTIRFAHVAAQSGLAPLVRQESARMFAPRPRRELDLDEPETRVEPVTPPREP